MTKKKEHWISRWVLEPYIEGMKVAGLLASIFVFAIAGLFGTLYLLSGQLWGILPIILAIWVLGLSFKLVI